MTGPNAVELVAMPRPNAGRLRNSVLAILPTSRTTYTSTTPRG